MFWFLAASVHGSGHVAYVLYVFLITLTIHSFSLLPPNHSVPQSYAELRQISHLRLEKNFLSGSINFLCDSFATGVQLFADTGEVECRCCAR